MLLCRGGIAEAIADECDGASAGAVTLIFESTDLGESR